jgi:hypothetical protein
MRGYASGQSAAVLKNGEKGRMSVSSVVRRRKYGYNIVKSFNLQEVLP